MKQHKLGVGATEAPMPHPAILDNFQKLENLPSLPGITLKILEAVSKVTMNFGVALFQPGTSLSKEELIKQADHALYEAKRRGRNRVCVNACS